MLRATRLLGRLAAVVPSVAVRRLNIHEYQSQALMASFGVNVPAGKAVSTPEEALHAAKELGFDDYVVKAQVLAGGRGLGVFNNGFKGGVHICHSPMEVGKVSAKMLGHRLVTKQTGHEGKLVHKVLVTRRLFLRREAYVSFVLDRQTGGPVIIGSSQGGVDIEMVAHEQPEAIIKMPIDIRKGLSEEQAREMASKLGFNPSKEPALAEQLLALYKFFKDTDATQVEVNPLAETSNGEVMCVDAKVNFDDNASFRQKDIFQLADTSQMDLREVEAVRHDLNLVSMEGNIGCLVNGAGLAMATMDIIKLHGGSPANFLDIGGGATQAQVTLALKILASFPDVDAIFINIFGGIMRCDIIALGIINAVQSLKLNLPLVVRLSGTNVALGKKLLEDSGLRVIASDDLDDAAKKAVRVAQIVDMAKQANLNVSFELPL